MATAGKVPTLGFLGRIKNLVWLGFGAGAAASGVQPIIALRGRYTRVIALDGRAAHVVEIDGRYRRVIAIRGKV